MPVVKKHLIKLRDLLSQEQTQILQTALLLMLPALLTKITGQVFNLVLTSSYPASDSRINQFFIANAVPELLTSVLMIGTVGTVIIPVLVASREAKGKEYFYRIYSSIINVSILIFAAISAVLVLFADKFIPAAIALVNTELPPSAVELNNIIWMMRALILPQLLLGVSVFISTGLNIYNRFLLPQLSPLFYNIGRIIAILILLPLTDYSPWAIVAAAYIGSILHLVIQIPLFISLKIKYLFVIDYRDPHVSEVAKLSLPRILVLASDQIGFLVNNFISLAFIAGPATLNYAKSLYLVIPSMFGYTFSYASYPMISKLYFEKNFSKVKEIAQKTINEIIFMAIPFVVVLIVLRVPIVRLVYGIIPGTAFTLQDSYQVAWILFFFSFGLIFITARWFVFSMFYATKDTIIPSIVTAFSLGGVILLSIFFTNLLSYNTQFAVSNIEVNPQGDSIFSTTAFIIFSGFASLGTGVLYLSYRVLRMFLILISNSYKKLGEMIFAIPVREKRSIKLINKTIFITIANVILVVLGVVLLSNSDIQYFLNRSPEPNRAGVGGISLAMSVVYTIEFMLMVLLFSRTKLDLDLPTLVKSISKKFIAAICMFGFMYYTYKLWHAWSYTDNFTGSTSLNMLILTVVTTVPGFMIYYLVSLLFKIEELSILRKYLNPIFRFGGLEIPESKDKVTAYPPSKSS